MKVRPHEQTSALIARALDGATPEEKHWLLVKESERIVDELLDSLYSDGWDAPPLHILYMKERLLYRGEADRVPEILRLQHALTTDITRVVHGHHAWRHVHEGNVVWEFTGPTGTGKSSCMLGLMERHNGLTPEKLPQRITIDISELPHILPSLQPGEAVVVDEQSALIGEGSLTLEKVLRNIEDQIRLSQVDLYWGSPQSNREHTTTQGKFEAVAVNKKERKSRFIAWVGDFPVGHCDLDWASPTLWSAYCPIKEANVARAKAALFDTREALYRRIRDLFELEAIQVWCEDHRPKRPEWELLIKRYSPGLATAQVRTMALEIDSMLDVLDNRKDDFETFYGFEPTPSMAHVAEQTD